MKLGIDISTYFEEQVAGAKYKLDGKFVDPIDVFHNNGVDYIRIRVWVNPYMGDKPYLGGTCDLGNFLKLSKLALGKGYQVILNLHYSDFWCDPSKQFIPKEWESLDFKGLRKKVHSYTTEVLTTIIDNGVTLAYVQVGNEITNGFLWPLGQLVDNGPNKERGNYKDFTSLLKEGVKAVREKSPDSKIVLHLERSYDKVLYKEFFTNMRRYKVDYDVIGVSYYPYWHGTFVQFFANMRNCKRLFKKDIAVMETGYGFTMEDYIANGNEIKPQLVIEENFIKNMPYKLPYSLSKKGQKAFIKTFLNKCRKHDISLVVYWEPAWIPGKDIHWTSKEGQKYMNDHAKSTRNEWANQCLFDFKGKAVPALKEFSNKEEQS